MTPGPVLDLLKSRGYIDDAQGEELAAQMQSSGKDVAQAVVVPVTVECVTLGGGQRDADQKQERGRMGTAQGDRRATVAERLKQA